MKGKLTSSNSQWIILDKDHQRYLQIWDYRGNNLLQIGLLDVNNSRGIEGGVDNYALKLHKENALTYNQQLKAAAPVDVDLSVEGTKIQDLQEVNTILRGLHVVEYTTVTYRQFKPLTDKRLVELIEQQKLRHKLHNQLLSTWQSIPITKCKQIASLLDAS